MRSGAPGKLSASRILLFSGIRDDALALLAESRDAEGDHVAGLRVMRRLHAEAHTGRRAGGDDVAGEQRHDLADVGDEVRAAEAHGARAAALALLAVHVEPPVEHLRIGDL